MTTKQRGPGSLGFLPMETNVGGAHQILSDYLSFHKRVSSAGPTKEVLRTKKQEPTYDSQRLSRNRAARLGTTSHTQWQHLTNVHHMARRIEDMYAQGERRKNPHDPSVHPARQARPMQHGRAHAPSLLGQLKEPWVQGYGYSTLTMSPRPGSAPSGWASRRREREGDGYQGWSVTQSLRDVFPSDEFPLTRYAKGPLNQAALSKAVYKQSILADVIESRLYKNADLKHLFQAYIRDAPLHDKQFVEVAVAELRQELMVEHMH